MRGRLGHRVAVSADGPRVFLYAGTEIAPREAERVVREVMAQRGIGAGLAVERWHPAEDDWQEADVAMPQTDKERQAEHQRLDEDETRESLATGPPSGKCAFKCHRIHVAAALAGWPQAEGRPVIRRWKVLVLGANGEDDARDLAKGDQAGGARSRVRACRSGGPGVALAQYGPIPVW